MGEGAREASIHKRVHWTLRLKSVMSQLENDGWMHPRTLDWAQISVHSVAAAPAPPAAAATCLGARSSSPSLQLLLLLPVL